MSLEQKQKIYFSRLSSWAPGLQSHADWLDWASGKKKILLDSSAPKLEFTPALFRRRLSQLSKMTIQVIHDSLLLGKDESGREIFEDLKIFFTSFRGEYALLQIVYWSASSLNLPLQSISFRIIKAE